MENEKDSYGKRERAVEWRAIALEKLNERETESEPRAKREAARETEQVERERDSEKDRY